MVDTADRRATMMKTGMNRDPKRIAAAVLLVASAALFVIGSRIERHGSTASPSPSQSSEVQASPSTGSASSPRPSPTPPAKTLGGEGSAAHEAAEHASPSPTTSAQMTVAEPAKTPTAGVEGAPSREAAERTTGHASSSERVFGVDVEQPGIVTSGAVIMVALALLMLGWRRRRVLVAVAVFALAFAAFDVREALHQATEGRTSLIVIASVLASMHLTAALLAGLAGRKQE